MEMDPDGFFESHPNFRPYADLVVIPPSREELVEEFPEAGSDSDFAMDQYTRTQPLTRYALYVISRREGNDHKFASMASCQRTPKGVTDDLFWNGRAHFSQMYGDDYANDIRRILKNQGVTLGAHEDYCPELARFRGDKEAVISRSQGRGHIKRLCESRGWACEGMVNTDAREPERDPFDNSHGMANDLVVDNAQRMVQANPDLQRKSKRELRDMVLEKHGPGG